MSSRGVVPMRMATSRLRLSWPRLLTLLWHAFHGCAGMPVVFVSDYLLMEAEPRVSGGGRYGGVADLYMEVTLPGITARRPYMCIPVALC
jgi:hypothetical protein